MQKTIFIIITRSFITRNILRSGVLALLKERGYRVVVFFQAKSIPKDIEKEFSDSQVTLVAQPFGVRGMHARFTELGLYLINTKTTRLLATYRTPAAKRLATKDLPKPPVVMAALRRSLLFILSSLGIFRWAYRWAERALFSEKNPAIRSYFETHQPSLVFSTSVVSSLDITFMKEARRRGIRTVSMPKSWDNVTNQYYRVIPDYFLVQNDTLKHYAEILQDIPRERIITVGVPQFDWYARKDVLRTRQEHFRAKGLDSKRKLIFFGSEGLWASHDHVIAEKIQEWIEKGALIEPCQLLARPHYTNAAQDVFKNVRGKPHAAVDDFPIVSFLYDQWDQKETDIIDFTNSVAHCDVMVNVASTLALDAACADRPTISVGFGCAYKGGVDSTPIFYQSDHNGWVVETGAVLKPESFNELKQAINDCLLDARIRADRRALLREKLCYRVDGQSSRRIADALSAIAG